MSGRRHSAGDVVEGKTCPECGGTLVYNGNYFCGDWGRGCDWAMAEDDDSRWALDVIATYLLQKREEALAEGRMDTVERMNFYLVQNDALQRQKGYVS